MSYPLWIGNKLQGVILLFMAWQIIYLWRKRKELIVYRKKDFLFWQMGVAIGMLLFSCMIYKYGIYYGGFSPIRETGGILSCFGEPFLLYGVAGLFAGQLLFDCWIMWKQKQGCITEKKDDYDNDNRDR